MKIMSKRRIENLLLILFPAALFIGCTGIGEEKPKLFNATAMSLVGAQSLVRMTNADDVNVTTKPELTAPTVGTVVVTPAGNVTKTSISYGKLAGLANTEESHLNSGQLVDVIYFATDKYNINAVLEAQLAAHAKLLKENPGLSLIISGHADERGAQQHNLHLSELRAKAVEGLLLSMGVNENQLIINCFGASIPTQDISHWQENRRVELQYSFTTVSQAL